MSGRILEVVEYNKDWPRVFAAEKSALEQILSGIKLTVHHIGSTSVPGLSAKPIIDILIVCDSIESLDGKTVGFEQLGYLVKGEFGIAGRRYFQKGGVQRSHHVHAYQEGDNNIDRHMAFRNYLIEYPDIALQYANIKLNAIAHCDNNMDQYMAMKDSFIKEHELKALHWVSEQVTYAKGSDC